MSEKLSAKQYAEQLLYKPEYAADKQPDVKEKAAAFAEGYKNFLDHAKTEREAAATSEQMLLAAGYKPFEPKKTYAPGEKIYFIQEHKAVVAATIGQKPFEEGAEIVTGSTHKTFFGPQRGVIGVNYRREDLKWGLWETIQSRAFPGSVSNHHLGTQLGLLMAAYEMNYFKDSYQKAVIDNAKYFAKALHEAGLHVLGDPAIGYTETHQVLVDVGYGTGPEVAERLEENNIIVNYQATPDEEGFTASGALRMGVSEMTRFGFGQVEFTELAGLMADCILRGKDVGQEVSRLRSRYTTMHYCFDGPEFQTALEQFMGQIGF